MYSVYHKSKNIRYFSSLIAKITITKEHYQGLFKEKEKKISKSFKRKREVKKLL